MTLDGASGVTAFQDNLDRSTAGIKLSLYNFEVDLVRGGPGGLLLKPCGGAGASGFEITSSITWRNGVVTDPAVADYLLTIPRDQSLDPLACDPGFIEDGPICSPCPAGKYEVNNKVCLDSPAEKFSPTEALSESDIEQAVYSCDKRSKYQEVVEKPTAGLSERISLVSLKGAVGKTDCSCEKGTYQFGGDADSEETFKAFSSVGKQCVKCPEESAVCEGSNYPPIAEIGYGLIDSASASGLQAVQQPGQRAILLCRWGGTTCKVIQRAQQEAREQTIQTGSKVEWCVFRKPGGGASTNPSDANFLDESDPRCYCLGGSVDDPRGCCDCIGGKHGAHSITQIDSNVARCGPGYKDGSALCSLCEDGYALKANECVKCQDKAGHIILPLVLFPLILLFIQRLTGSMESTEISLAFLQFLGVYSGFGVRWTSDFQGLLSAFSIANVDVDLLGLACGEIDFETMWVIQAIILPMLYVAFVLFDTLVSWIMLQLAKAQFRPVMFLIGLEGRQAPGSWFFPWRPTRSFSLSSIADRYLPHALMYLNIYYLTGVSKALVLLQCTDAEDGSKSYLDAAPSLPCWEGTHAKMMGYNVISLILYVVLVPVGYSYILFIRCRKEGLDAPRLYRVYGFLWGRFENRCYWWEMVEISLRKLPLVVISIFIPGAIYKCILGILLIGALMAFNFIKEPYIMYRHDLLDQSVATAEVLLMLFGILAEYRAEGNLAGLGEFVDQTETVCYIILALVFFFAFSQLGLDVKLYIDNYKFKALMSKRRTKAKSALSADIFQLEGPLLGPFIDGANPEKLASLRKVEAMFAKIARRVEKPGSRSKESQKVLAHKMGAAMPQMMDWLIEDAEGPTRLQLFTGDLVAHKQKQDTGGAAVTDLLDEKFATDSMLKWLLDAASKSERKTINDILKSIAEVVPTFAENDGESAIEAISDEKDEQISVAETYKQLMKDLADDTPCEMVILTPVETEEESRMEIGPGGGVSYGAKSAKMKQIDVELTGMIDRITRLSVRSEESGCSDADANKILSAVRAWNRVATPAGLCVTSRQPVVVNCILNDERFQGAASSKLGVVAISQLHVPLFKDGSVAGVLSLINKVSYKTGKSGGPFDPDSDVQAAVSCASLLVEATKFKAKMAVLGSFAPAGGMRKAALCVILAQKLRKLAKEDKLKADNAK